MTKCSIIYQNKWEKSVNERKTGNPGKTQGKADGSSQKGAGQKGSSASMATWETTASLPISVRIPCITTFAMLSLVFPFGTRVGTCKLQSMVPKSKTAVP